MKRVMLAVLALLMFSVSAMAQSPAGVKPYYKGPFIKRALIATAACGIGIGLSGNPATAAEIGLPILIGGNAAAYKLDRSGHPRWSAFVQTISPLGCFMHYGPHTKIQSSSLKNRPPVKVQDPSNGPTNPPSNPPSGSTGGTGSTGSGSGSTSGSGSGSGSGTGSGGSGGSTGGSSGSSGGGTGGGNGHGCIQDCGFPGNGGSNGGHDINKPPFPGKGNGGSNAGNGKK